MSISRIFNTLSLLLIAGVTLAACSAQSPEETPTDDAAGTQQVEQMDETTGAETDSEMDTEADRQLTVDMYNFGYSQETIEASPGETIEITLTNSEGYHDFVIDELDVDSGRTNAGEVTTATVTIPEDTAVGTSYEYYCSVGNHRAQGMVGTLEVVAE